ncbi:MAG TPA: class I SAM-dependent methyltransferase, partial [Burkholderiaceae bacterium]
QRGHRVTGVDRDADAVAPLGAIAEIVVADIESGPWPFTGRTFDAVVVTHYLWRERMPDILASVAPGGLLLYETFAAGNESVGKPSNPKFLLQPGELLRLCAGWRVIAFEDGFEDAPARFVQRIVAARPGAPAQPEPRRFGLVPAGPPAQVKSADSEDSA